MFTQELIQRLIIVLFAVTATSFVVSNLIMTYLSWTMHHYGTGKKQKVHAFVIPGLFLGKTLAQCTKKMVKHSLTRVSAKNF